MTDIALLNHHNLLANFEATSVRHSRDFDQSFHNEITECCHLAIWSANLDTKSRFPKLALISAESRP